MFVRPNKRFPASRTNIPRPSCVGTPPSKGDFFGAAGTEVIWLLGLVLACAACTPPAPLDEAAQPYYFDTGSPTSEHAEGTIRLTPSMAYDTTRGFGWTEPPTTSFSRPDLARSRDAFTLDGVTGQRLAFRADVPPGTWWMTLWMEAGIEDSSTAALMLNDVAQTPAWYAFPPPAEPRTVLQRIYRLTHRRVEVGADGVRIEWTGGADSVRVLGFSLMPDPQPASPRHRALLERLRAAGRYDALVADGTSGKTVFDAQNEATDVLDTLLAAFETLHRENPSDAFAAYWREQLDLLIRAERLFAMRGWEWANRDLGLSLFDRLHQTVMLLDGVLDRPDPDAYPFYERALHTRGRLLYWLGRERGGPADIAAGRRDLAWLAARHPDDKLLAMYAGEKIDLPDPCDELPPTAGAPAWSVAQREVLCRLRHTAHWWVNDQQAPNGEFGGKLGDDVELLRWWPPLILSGDTTALAGWQRLADGVWNSRQIHDGYARLVSDVEHASEFISDTAPLMALFSDDPAYTDRLRPSARHFETLWTGLTPAGRRFFRSAWFSSTEIDDAPPKNRDVEYNTRAAKAVRYLAWETGDADATRLLHEWSKAWADAARRTDKGKPAGLIPASIRFPDEALNGDGPTWHRANMYWTYFDWSHHAGSMMLDQLLFAYTLTDDASLLHPLLAALDLIRAHENAAEEPHAPGSPAWAAAHLRDNSTFWSVAAQWRLLTADTRYDDLLTRYGTPYLRYRLTGDEAHLTDGLQAILETVRYNTPLRTAEAIHTDRVYVSANNEAATALQAMLTADGMPEGMSPYHAVSWAGTDATFTALVTDTGPSSLALHLFSHAATERPATLRLWHLPPGPYRLTHRLPDGSETSSTIDLIERGQSIPLTLPAQTLLRMRVEKAP